MIKELFFEILPEMLVLAIASGALFLFFSIIKTYRLWQKTNHILVFMLLPFQSVLLLSYIEFFNSTYSNPNLDSTIWALLAALFSCRLTLLSAYTYLEKKFEHTGNKPIQITHENYFDSLTKLPNRHYLLKDLEDNYSKKHSEFSLLTLLINNFSSVKEVLGHEKSEYLFKEFAFELSKYIDDDTAIFHTQINGFCLLVPSTEISYLAQFTNHLISTFEHPELIEKLGLSLTLSIGIVIYPNQSTQANELLQFSEQAALNAKRNHKTVVYHSQHDSAFVNNATLLTELNRAIKNNVFTLYYQRIKCVKKPNRLCFEVLLRWPTENGFVSPADFIPLAEQSNNIQTITRWVFASAFAQLERWNKVYSNISLQINLSSKDIQSDKIVHYLTALLAKHSIKPCQITLEITETSMMLNIFRAKEILNELHKLGFKISIDDYGTGFSSLSILNEMPINEIKIDRSFITNVMNRKSNEAIVRSTIHLAHSLNCEVVAEGIEASEIANYLIAMGCDKLQGFYFSKPLPIEKVNKLIERIRLQNIRAA